MTMRTALSSLALAAALLSAPPLALAAAPALTPAAVPTTAASPAAGRAAALADTELDKLRGGFLVADGIVFDFGAVTRTFIDGQLALQTQLTWSPDGAHLVSTGGGEALALDPAALGALSAAGINPAALGGASAVVSADGTALALQSVSASGLSNLLVNTGSGHALAQSTDVTLTLPGFQAVQGQISTALAASRVAQSIAQTAMQPGLH